MDMQVGVVGKAYRRNEVIAAIQNLIELARSENAPVIWIQHSDEAMPPHSEGWQLVPELIRNSTDPLIFKIYGDAFEDTKLTDELDSLNVGRVVVTGAQTDACIRATIHGAFTRGYDTTLVSDAHTTEDLTSYGLPPPQTIIEFTNTYWTWQSAPRRKATVEKSTGVKFGA